MSVIISIITPILMVTWLCITRLCMVSHRAHARNPQGSALSVRLQTSKLNDVTERSGDMIESRGLVIASTRPQQSFATTAGLQRVSISNFLSITSLLMYLLSKVQPAAMQTRHTERRC
jgi:hypothetical protein